MRRTTIAALLATALLGFGVARLTASPSSSPEQPSAPATRVVERTTIQTDGAAPLDRAALRDDIRAMLREELAGRGDSAPAPTIAEVAAPTADEQAARARTDELVGAIIDARRLTRERSLELRAAMSTLAADEYAEVMRQLSQAVNRQELKLDPDAVL